MEAGLLRFKVLDQIAQGKTAVQDIFGDKHMTALDLAGEVFDDANHTGALHAVAVGRNGHVVHFDRQVGFREPSQP